MCAAISAGCFFVREMAEARRGASTRALRQQRGDPIRLRRVRSVRSFCAADEQHRHIEPRQVARHAVEVPVRHHRQRAGDVARAADEARVELACRARRASSRCASSRRSTRRVAARAPRRRARRPRSRRAASPPARRRCRTPSNGSSAAFRPTIARGCDARVERHADEDRGAGRMTDGDRRARAERGEQRRRRARHAVRATCRRRRASTVKPWPGRSGAIDARSASPAAAAGRATNASTRPCRAAAAASGRAPSVCTCQRRPPASTKRLASRFGQSRRRAASREPAAWRSARDADRAAPRLLRTACDSVVASACGSGR